MSSTDRQLCALATGRPLCQKSNQWSDEPRRPAHVFRWSAAGYDEVLVEGSERHAAPQKAADAPGRYAVEVGGAFLTGKLPQIDDRHVGGVRHGTGDAHLGIGRDCWQTLQGLS